MITRAQPIPCLTAVLALLFGAPVAAADHPIEDGNWHTALRLYGWLPSVSGETRFDLGNGGGDATVDTSQILDAVKMSFMGSAQVRKGRWTGFTDLIYLRMGADQQGGIRLPAAYGSGINVHADEELKGWVWTLGGGYTLWYNDRANVDLVLGARLFDLDSDLALSVTGPRNRTLPANLSASVTLWDAIIGVYGRVDLSSHWFVPYYLDVGTGDTELTSTGYTGVGYAFDWGDLTLTYRYLYYDQGNDKTIEGLTFNGFAAGVNFRF
ncbi:hypothetical protein CCR95_23800 [Thiocystis minor]|uniref:hypothetical protein n=1 Tax=Thiocystis minor TaxID=61597 RepID=UPI00191400DF|nr:hypothetical protein [Thiocystis minor]MBK5967009.1 hypothetical protein [Thiocystis minor]